MITGRFALYLFTLLLLFSGVGGCASWFSNDLPDPQVHLVKVEVVRAKLLEQKFLLHFRVDNPNDEDLTVRPGISHSSGGRPADRRRARTLVHRRPQAQCLLQGADPHQPVAQGSGCGETAEKTRATDSLSSGRHT